MGKRSGEKEIWGQVRIKRTGFRARARDTFLVHVTPKRVNGGGKGTRTPDLFIANEPLSQLSYTPTRKAPTKTKAQTVLRMARIVYSRKAERPPAV